MPSAKAGIELIVFQNRELKDLDGVVKDCAEGAGICRNTAWGNLNSPRI